MWKLQRNSVIDPEENRDHLLAYYLITETQNIFKTD